MKYLPSFSLVFWKFNNFANTKKNWIDKNIWDLCWISRKKNFKFENELWIVSKLWKFSKKFFYNFKIPKNIKNTKKECLYQDFNFNFYSNLAVFYDDENRIFKKLNKYEKKLILRKNL